MNRPPTAPEQLRRLLARPGIIVAPGAADALTALLIEEAKFEAVHCTGGGIARSFGLPDLGYVTQTELVDRIASMTEACSLPMLVDADSGFGNALNVQRTVRLLERIGAAGMHIEDEDVPPRHQDALRNLASADAMVARLQAAMSARANPAFVIVARTNAAQRKGLDEAIARANAYAAAGADLIYVEHLKTRKDIEAVARRIEAPKMLSQNKGQSALLTTAELADLGFKLVAHPSDAQLASIFATREILNAIKHNQVGDYDRMISFAERDTIVGAARDRETFRRFTFE